MRVLTFLPNKLAFFSWYAFWLKLKRREKRRETKNDCD